MKFDLAHGLIVLDQPSIEVGTSLSRLSDGAIDNKPISLRLDIGLHLLGPGEIVGAIEDRDEFLDGRRHVDRSG